jgi:pimeloyl-ACP methyl ester carboxylesterase
LPRATLKQPVSPRTSSVTVAGGAIDILSDGEGPRLTILHRDTGRSGWTPLHERLARRFQVIAPSLPGYDASDRPDWLRNVADLSALVGLMEDGLDGPPAAMLGLGFGGWVAAELAAVPRLILHAPMGIKPLEGEIADQFLIEAEDYARLGFTSDDAYERERAGEAGDRSARLDRNREMTTRIAWKPAMFDLGLKHLLRGISMPTLVVWSSGDAIVPQSCANAYCDAVDGARYAEIPGGHVAEYEAPDALAELVEGFLGC